MKIKTIRNASGLTQEAFARKYNIPKRTLEGWEAGKRKPPVYVLLLLDRVVREDTKKTEKEKPAMNEFYNTIILKLGVGSYSKKQFNNFTEGDCICGENASPEELKRWTGDQYDLAKAELAKYSCSYRKSGGYMFADEYALEYCNTDEDGEFLDGSDLDLAEKEA